MANAFFFIDNFWENPDEIRNRVINGALGWYPEQVSEGFPNGNAPWQGKMTTAKCLPSPKYNLESTIAKFTGKNVVPLQKLEHAKFRLSKTTDKESPHKIHADGQTVNDKNKWAGVLYLTPTTQEIEGTIFYKNTMLNKSYLTDNKDVKSILNFGSDDPNQWQKELISYFVYNRLIVYRADMFHAPGPTFGDTDETGRLVQLFFWEEL